MVLRVGGFQGQQWCQPYKAEATATYQHFERIYARGKEAPEISALLTMMIIKELLRQASTTMFSQCYKSKPRSPMTLVATDHIDDTLAPATRKMVGGGDTTFFYQY